MNDLKINWDKLKGLNDEEIEIKAKEILSFMTIEEKLWQMVFNGEISFVQNLISGKRIMNAPFPAGVDKNLGIPGVLFTDGPRGVVLGDSTCFPVSMARGATWDLELEEQIGNAIGIEAKAQRGKFLWWSMY
jgi:beta-glucosidase